MANRQSELIIQRGKNKGKRYLLEKDLIRIGSAKQCEINVQGESVSENHAVVVKTASGWVLESQSVSGVLVNQQRIDKHNLRVGDIIQIGSETLIRFQKSELNLSKEESESGNTGSKNNTFGLFRNPIVVIGLGCYFAVLGGIAIYLMGDSKTTSQIVTKNNEQLINEAESWLDEQVASKNNQENYVWAMNVEAKTVPSITYYRLLALDVDDLKGAPGSELKKQILDDLRLNFFKAWRFEGQGRFREAIRQYYQITLLIPDIRCPATKYATQRRLFLRKRLKSG